MKEVKRVETNSEVFESAIVPVLPLRDMVVFPGSITPLFVVRPRSLAAIDEALSRDKFIFTTLQKNLDLDTPAPSDLEPVGTICEILQVLRVPDGSAKVLIEGSHVARSVEYTPTDKFLQALTVRVHMEELGGNRARAMARVALQLFHNYSRLSEKIPEELLQTIQKTEDPYTLVNSIAHYSALKTEDKQRLLVSNCVEEKFILLHSMLNSENEILEIEQKIFSAVKTQIGRTQREYFLNEQLKAIERELGINQDDENETLEFEEKIGKAGMPTEVRERAQKELRRLGKMAPLSPEATVTRTYLEWLTEIPWSNQTEDKIDLTSAAKTLNADHHGLEKIKDRILEHLAVVRQVGATKGQILCFVGPPGVGKTSLARSIATCMGRNFVRVSLGGVRDEAEIRGHRRTYIGALPGKVVQQMKRAGSINPVFLLDEIDKMSSDFRGDPASALLEVLDPEQNKAFNDHYLEVDYDLSKVMFICTANTMDSIPLPLLDRMEVIRLAGYTELEKRHIATRYLIPRQIASAGLKRQHLRFTIEGLRRLITGYTKEAGVRNLEREIGSVCRKVTKRLQESGSRQAKGLTITPALLREFLGPVRFRDTSHTRTPEIGAALGLAWTEFGGEVLPVETTIMSGKGSLVLTGKLGEVMQESGKTALSYVRAHAEELGIALDIFKDIDIHVHMPEGAIPKDGPSAGITIATSIASALSRRRVRQDVAMTGELTLRGKVLKIGGLKEKVLAAHRLGVQVVVIPEENKDELEDVPAEVLRRMTIIGASHLDQVLDVVLLPQKHPKKIVPPRVRATLPEKGSEPGYIGH